MKENTKTAYRTGLKLVEKQQALAEFFEKDTEDEMALTELADSLVVMRKLEKLFEDTRKRVSRQKEQLEMKICLLWSNAETNRGEPIRTEYTTASPQVTPVPKLPTFKDSPEDWVKLCGELGIPESYARADCFRIHYPNFVAMLQERMAEGLPAPQGVKLDTTHQKFSVRLSSRGKKEILEEE